MPPLSKATGIIARFAAKSNESVVKFPFMRTLFLTIAIALCAPAAAQLYACTENGKTSYISDPTGRDCELQKSYEPSATGAGAGTAPAAAPKSTPSPAPAQAQGKKPPAAAPVKRQDMPVVSAATQKVRDEKREDILQQELHNESELFRSLDSALEAEKAKAQHQQNAQRIASLTERRRIRAQNIIAIKQELARLQP